MKRDLRGKLRRSLGDASTPTPRAAPVRSGAGLRAYLERRRDRLAGPPRPPVELPDGEERENAYGSFFVRSMRYPWDMVHGWFPLGSATGTDLGVGPRAAAGVGAVGCRRVQVSARLRRSANSS